MFLPPQHTINLQGLLSVESQGCVGIILELELGPIRHEINRQTTILIIIESLLFIGKCVKHVPVQASMCENVMLFCVLCHLHIISLDFYSLIYVLDPRLTGGVNRYFHHHTISY